jgi:FKBP-type peptidyl-prolyl cis-trans isomerase FkpA
MRYKFKSLIALLPLTFGAMVCHAAAPETLPSGIRISHTTVGTGTSPKASDTVKVHYRGTLADGKEFDSSYKRNAPATFALNRVIPCWTEGVQKVKVGGKATLTCPAATAYGDRGAAGVVPPGAILTFEIELLAIEK